LVALADALDQDFLPMCTRIVSFILHACAQHLIHTHQQTFSYTYKIILTTQDFVMAFMMGTHARLGTHSPVLLLDPYLAVSIAQVIIADRW